MVAHTGQQTVAERHGGLQRWQPAQVRQQAADSRGWQGGLHASRLTYYCCRGWRQRSSAAGCAPAPSDVAPMSIPLPCSFASFAFAAQSLLSALGVVQFISNIVFGRFVNKEKVRARAGQGGLGRVSRLGCSTVDWARVGQGGRLSGSWEDPQLYELLWGECRGCMAGETGAVRGLTLRAASQLEASSRSACHQ